jgi:NTE family protein
MDCESQIKNEIQRKIKHLVISGGSIWGFSAFGIIYEAICCGFVHMDDIQSIYSTSVGAVVGVMFSLHIDHIILKEYLVNRPWDQLCKKSAYSVLEIFDSKGIFQKLFFVEIFTPLFKSVDLSIDLTMQQLYDYNGIDFHIYVTELNTFTLVDISYKTHPEWLVIDAILASCSIPFLFSPVIKENSCYLDGGFFLNYPISKCIENVESHDEIFGISLGNNSKQHSSTIITTESSIFDLLNVLLNRVINHIDLFTNEKISAIPYTMHYFSKETTLDFCVQVLYNKNDRNDLIYNGISAFKEKYTEWS